MVPMAISGRATRDILPNRPRLESHDTMNTSIASQSCETKAVSREREINPIPDDRMTYGKACLKGISSYTKQ